MTNQQAPEIYTLHTVPNKGERPWSGIYAVRADAEHDAKVMRDATGLDWSVVRLVVADTAATPTGPITRYEVVDCIDSKHVPAVIPNGAGPWVRYEDHIAAMVGAQQHAAHVQNPAEIEHVAGDVSKNAPESNMAQQPSPSVASKAVLAAIRAANLQLVRTGDDDFMLVTLKQATPQADSQPAPEYVGNGMFKGETIEKAAEHWANWCDRRCMTGLSEFLRVVAARAPAESVLEDAARWQWLADYLIGERTDLDEGIVACATIDALRQFADAARKQGGV